MTIDATSVAQDRETVRRMLAVVAASFTTIASSTVIVLALQNDQAVGQAFVLGLVTIAFAIPALLILLNRPRHRVGWVMMFLAVGTTISGIADAIVSTMDQAPESVGVLGLLVLGFNNFGWVLLIFPILHLLLIFPTGRLLSPRWGFFVVLEVVMISVMVLAVMFSEQIGPFEEASWTIDNPIGFVSESFFEGAFSPIWTAGLMIMAIGGLVSVVIRFRGAKGLERQQMKWLLFAFGFFVGVYVMTAILQGFEGHPLLDIMFIVSVFFIPVAMAIAILRFRLFDIDLIIRRTVLYALLTGFLGALYLGSVVVMQTLFQGLGNSSIVVAASTLLVAGAFAPMRSRLQGLIDRRLFRTRYDVERVIEGFASRARNQSEMEALSGTLLEAVNQTMHPASAGVWIKGAV